MVAWQASRVLEALLTPSEWDRVYPRTLMALEEDCCKSQEDVITEISRCNDLLGRVGPMRQFEDHFHAPGFSGAEIVSNASDKDILADARAVLSLLGEPAEADCECLTTLGKVLPSAPHRRFWGVTQSAREAQSLKSAINGVWGVVLAKPRTLVQTLLRRVKRLDRSSEQEVLEAFAQVTRQCQAMTAVDVENENLDSQGDNESAARKELQTVLKAIESLIKPHLLLTRSLEGTYLHLTKGRENDYRLPITPLTLMGPANMSLVLR